MPPGAGVMQPIIKPEGIDDVPTVTLTLWTEDPSRGAHELQRVAHAARGQEQRHGLVPTINANRESRGQTPFAPSSLRYEPSKALGKP